MSESDKMSFEEVFDQFREDGTIPDHELFDLNDFVENFDSLVKEYKKSHDVSDDNSDPRERNPFLCQKMAFEHKLSEKRHHLRQLRGCEHPEIAEEDDCPFHSKDGCSAHLCRGRRLNPVEDSACDEFFEFPDESEYGVVLDDSPQCRPTPPEVDGVPRTSFRRDR